MFILGIETSCDETSAAVARDRNVLSNSVSSSVHLHKRYGGVVPEIACRYHVEYINHVLDDALKKSGKGLKDIGLIAVSHKPGLVGALLIGLSLGKALSLACGLPFLGVDHIIAHIFAPFAERKRPAFPFVGLVVSGGHTSLYAVEDFDKLELLGRTTDDAAGEAFDKVAKLLGLGYPGGPVIERCGRRGDPAKIHFPRPFLEEGSLDFSFSGLKTAVLYHVRKLSAGELLRERDDIAASFQEAVFDTLREKTLRACRKTGIRRVVVGGGVACNRRLREGMYRMAADSGIEAFIPGSALCADNAAMIAVLGGELYKKGHSSELSLAAEASS